MAIMRPDEAGEERKSDGEFIFHTDDQMVPNSLLKKIHMLRCRSIASLQRTFKYASARRFSRA
jgi:hypothetical protein